MNGLNNEVYVTMLIISNVAAILLLVVSIKWPRVARLLFFLLFAWASWVNWATSQSSPQSYLEYADLAWLGWYRDFIRGWFANHIPLAVGVIATCQGLIAISMLLKGWVFKMGGLAAIIFLVSILPLGVGSGFPCSAIMAIAIFILLKKHNNKYIWESNKQVTT